MEKNAGKEGENVGEESLLNENTIVGIEFSIEGMRCKSCAESIESRVKSLPGVREVRVDLAHDKAFVKYDANAVCPDDIKTQVRALGYSPSDGETKEKSDGKDVGGNMGCNGGGGGRGKSGWKRGLFYGLLPHTGCIAFIAGSVFGVTLLTQLFKPLLMSPYFFYALIALSLALATVSSALYLRNNGLLSTAGAKRSWKYLSIMYGSTVGVNLLFFLVVFPLLASTATSVQASPATGAVVAASGWSSGEGARAFDSNLASIKLSVNIPCGGHAPLITQELKTLGGVREVKFYLPNVFDVKYDASKTSREQILALDVFKTYKATALS